MYTIIYNIFFALKRIEWSKRESGNRIPKILKKTIDYIEWFYNILVKRIYEKFPSKKYGLNKKTREKEIIISLTSFPKRIDTLWITIETLLRQTMKPDKIILWLAESQFDGLESLPKKLLQLQNRGLTIRFCDDLRSHKKYYYTMKENPESIVVLVDDDTFYSYDLVEKLYKMHLKNPTEIVCMTPTMISDFNDMPSKWKMPHPYDRVEHSLSAQPYSGQGTLYPPHCMDEKYLFKKETIMNLCPYADDLWLKYMSLRKNTRVTAVYKLRYIPVTIYGTSESSLWYINGQDGKNDIQWQAILNYFKDEPLSR